MFPPLYHAHHSLHNQDLPFWQNLACQASEVLLELGVGTGRVTSPILQAGKRVIGLDIDFEMLAFLRSNLSEQLKEHLFLIQADFCRFRLGMHFDLIFLTCNTYSTLTHIQRIDALHCITSHLSPGGIFACSIPNPHMLKNLPQHGEAEIEEIFLHPFDHEPVQVISEWARRKDKFTLSWHYDHLLPDGSVKRLTKKVIQQLVSIDDYKEELLSAGFSEIQIFGDYNRSVYSPSSPNAIFIARR